MVAAVDLHQFAEARAPGTRLMDLRWPLAARHPQPGIAHPAPHGFLRQHQAMTFGQLLARECRSEIGVAFTHECHGPCTQIDGQLTVARLATLARHQPGWTIGLITPAQPADLPLTEVQPLGCLKAAQAAFNDRLDDLDSFQFAHGCRDQATPIHDCPLGQRIATACASGRKSDISN